MHIGLVTLPRILRAARITCRPLSALSTSVCATLIHARMHTNGRAPILTSASPAVDDFVNESNRRKWERNSDVTRDRPKKGLGIRIDYGLYNRCRIL